MGFLIPNIIEEDNKKEAQKLLDFKNTNYSCDELGKLYLKYESSKYHSTNNLEWHWATEDRLTDNGCVTKAELNNLEFIKICMDGKTLGCRISKLENPELYENFDFKDRLLKAISSVEDGKK
jgi:hypothetical protein